MAYSTKSLVILLLTLFTLFQRINGKIIPISSNKDKKVEVIQKQDGDFDDESEEEAAGGFAGIVSNLPSYALSLNKVLQGFQTNQIDKVVGGAFSFVPDDIRVGLTSVLGAITNTNLVEASRTPTLPPSYTNSSAIAYNVSQVAVPAIPEQVPEVPVVPVEVPTPPEVPQVPNPSTSKAPPRFVDDEEEYGDDDEYKE